MLIPHTFTPLIDETADPNANFIRIWEESHFIKDTHLNINTTNQPCDRFDIHSQLKKLQEVYNDTDPVFEVKDSVINRFSLMISCRDNPRESAPLKYILVQVQ